MIRDLLAHQRRVPAHRAGVRVGASDALPATLLSDLRTDHAGETGAVMIYRGILAITRDAAVRRFAQGHLATEAGHLAAIEPLLAPQYRSRLLTLWRCAGWLTGALPALEGERGKVTRLYARIAADPRHTDLELIHCEGITQRRYGEWSMAHVRLSDVDPQTKIVWPEFDPYSANGELVMARIDDLIAGGTLVPPPLS